MGYNHSENDKQWRANFGVAGADTTHYTFARLDQKTLSLNARINYTASPTLSLQFYAEPFISNGQYSNWRELADPRAEKYADRFKPFTSRGDPGGFIFRQFTSNSVLRWEYMPGSTLFLVWAQGRQMDSDRVNEFSFRRDLTDVFGERPNNTFLVKVSYWFNPSLTSASWAATVTSPSLTSASWAAGDARYAVSDHNRLHPWRAKQRIQFSRRDSSWNLPSAAFNWIGWNRDAGNAAATVNGYHRRRCVLAITTAGDHQHPAPFGRLLPANCVYTGPGQPLNVELRRLASPIHEALGGARQVEADEIAVMIRANSHERATRCRIVRIYRVLHGDPRRAGQRDAGYGE